MFGRLFIPIDSPRSPRREPCPPLWITIGLNIDNRELVLIALSKAKWKAQAAGIERQELSASEGHAYNVWDVFLFNESFGAKFKEWLIDNGASSEQALNTVREFGRTLAKMMEDIHKIDAIEKPIRARAISQLDLVKRMTQAQAAMPKAAVLRCEACGKQFETVEAKAQHWMDKCGKAQTE